MRRFIVTMSATLLMLSGAAEAQASINHPAEHRYAAHVAHYRRGGKEMNCLDHLWRVESSWNPWAVNQYSGAYGIPQALGHGHPYPLGRYRPQIRWGIRAYIRPRYKAACSAWRHEERYGWY